MPRPALDAAPAHAVSAPFDFDDFPSFFDYEGPGWTDPDTDLYGCEGKSYCTAQDVYEARDDHLDFDSVSTTRNGITLGIGCHGATWDIDYDHGGRVGVGNSPADFDLFLADFDVPLRRFEVDVEAPFVFDEGGARTGSATRRSTASSRCTSGAGPAGRGTSSASSR